MKSTYDKNNPGHVSVGEGKKSELKNTSSTDKREIITFEIFLPTFYNMS